MKTLSIALSALLALAFLPSAVNAAEQKPAFNEGWKKGRQTGFPIPRFVSLRSERANMRVGPSTDYATKWVYSVRGLPMEITEEYGNWRRVRDQDGVTGWMLAPLLSSRRTAVIGPWIDAPVALRSSPSAKARILARLAPKVRLNIVQCDGTWCETTVQNRRMNGFIDQGSLWGVYPGETID
ncbi:SH3 domain-containing protein [Rhizobium terrae]|uniref:SH3 domain-containing protein n=1 Tax=Rhizobium terrae TaxID=2171756 RepID=UPI000E3C9652|nr:SH3 domain-containing protein [Rhizobium terrae]